MSAFLACYSWVNRGGMGAACVLPVAGGLLDQSVSFVMAVRIVDNEMAAIDKRERARG